MGQKKRKSTLEVSSHDKEEQQTEGEVQSVGGKNSVLAKKS